LPMEMFGSSPAERPKGLCACVIVHWFVMFMNVCCTMFYLCYLIPLVNVPLSREMEAPLALACSLLFWKCLPCCHKWNKKVTCSKVDQWHLICELRTWGLCVWFWQAMCFWYKPSWHARKTWVPCDACLQGAHCRQLLACSAIRFIRKHQFRKDFLDV
jgi:hypothetical protein